MGNMALDDAQDLGVECPLCMTVDVEIVWWAGAWRQILPNDGPVPRNMLNRWKRVFLKPGETKTVQCKCNSCGHEWEEYVKGV